MTGEQNKHYRRPRYDIFKRAAGYFRVVPPEEEEWLKSKVEWVAGLVESLNHEWASDVDHCVVVRLVGDENDYMDMDRLTEHGRVRTGDAVMVHYTVSDELVVVAVTRLLMDRWNFPGEPPPVERSAPLVGGPYKCPW